MHLTGGILAHPEWYLKSVDVKSAPATMPDMVHPQVKAAFGRRVRELRQAKGWSQEHLADVVGLDRSYVGSVERGERNISLENIAKFARALGVTLSNLMDFNHG